MTDNSEALLNCKVCQSTYKDGNVCDICGENVGKIHEPNLYNPCYIECGACKKIICKKHENDYFNCIPLNSCFYRSFCTKCCFKDKTGGYSYIPIKEVLGYIENLKSEIERLQMMVYYQPGGQGFEEAREHFEDLLKK